MEHQSRIEPERLVFIDETWTKTNMAPLRGWAARGARLVAKVPHGPWKTMTFVAALRHDRIEAPFVLDGPINGECFKTYVEKVLAPTLAPGDLVIMDNLGSHKGKAIRRAIRSAGAKLFFLPKYSPDLNPIEHVFAKLKHLLRKAAARTFETLIAAIGQLLGTYTTQECANYFANAGYSTNLKASRSRQRKELNVVKRERWTEADLDELPAEEPDGFDRKAGQLFETSQDNFLNSIAKALSAFANSGGGSLILGIKDDGLPDGLRPFVGRTAMRDWIEQKIPHLLDYPLSDFRVHTVTKSDVSRTRWP
jgi:putative transposase